MTYKNLKALRKSREYQALIVDLVSVGVVPKATAEGLLGYNIPANLITDDENSGTDNPIDDGGGSGGGSGEGSSNIVTVLYFDATANDNAGAWRTAEYDLTDDPTGTGIIAFAVTEFDDDTLNGSDYVQIDPAYVEGTSDIYDKYIPVDPQPTAPASGMLIWVYHSGSVNVDITVPGNTVTLLYYDTTGGMATWETAEYDLTDDPTGTGIIAFAVTEFFDDAIDSMYAVEANPDYVVGVSNLTSKYLPLPLDSQPSTLESGMLFEVYSNDSGSKAGNNITLLYFNEAANNNAGAWITVEYNLINDPNPDSDVVLAFAKDAFMDVTLDAMVAVEANPEYVEGESSLTDKYITMSPQPETLEPRVLIKVYHSTEDQHM